jgi:hypothetical protein
MPQSKAHSVVSHLLEAMEVRLDGYDYPVAVYLIDLKDKQTVKSGYAYFSRPYRDWPIPESFTYLIGTEKPARKSIAIQAIINFVDGPATAAKVTDVDEDYKAFLRDYYKPSQLDDYKYFSNCALQWAKQNKIMRPGYIMQDELDSYTYPIPELQALVKWSSDNWRMSDHFGLFQGNSGATHVRLTLYISVDYAGIPDEPDAEAVERLLPYLGNEGGRNG